MAIVAVRLTPNRPLKNAGLKEKGKMKKGTTDHIIRESVFLPFEFCLFPSVQDQGVAKDRGSATTLGPRHGTEHTVGSTLLC
jgi:hypothetical protein